MVSGCSEELGAAALWRAWPGRRWEAVETGSGGAPLLRCGRRKKGLGGPSGAKKGQMGRLAGWAGWPKSEENFFFK
jgi:hypothetical protein